MFKMDLDSAMKADDKQQLQVEEETNDDCCRVDVAEIVALGTGGCSTTERVLSGDWFGDVREVDLADLKQEPRDVCLCPTYLLFSLSQQNEFKAATLLPVILQYNAS